MRLPPFDPNADTVPSGEPVAKREALPADPEQNANATDGTSAGVCLGDDTLLAFIDGRLDASRQAEVDVHLDVCERCTELVQSIAVSEREASSTPLSRGWVTTFSKGKFLARRFEIVRFVDKGGMGEVYEALDRRIAGRVALKTVLCNVSDDPRALSRLCDELKLARRVAHPNVCKLYDLHEHQDAGRGHPVNFLAMEFVDGETLKQRLRNGPIPMAEACLIAKKLLLGLSAAHAAGVLHLDFKSGNVMLRHGCAAPEPVIMDFSLSRAFDKQVLLRTSERHLAGSIGYMSPEQLECRPTLDAASDIYSFGVVLFEMLTGVLPFRGDSAATVIVRQLKENAPLPSATAAGLSPLLDAFVAKCLSRKPQDRYESAEVALQAFEQTVARPQALHARRGRRLGTMAMAAAVLGLGVYVAAANRRSEVPTSTPVSRPTLGEPSKVVELPSQPATRLEPLLPSSPPTPASPEPATTVASAKTAPAALAKVGPKAAKQTLPPTLAALSGETPSQPEPLPTASSQAGSVELDTPQLVPDPLPGRPSLLLSNGKRATAQTPKPSAATLELGAGVP